MAVLEYIQTLIENIPSFEACIENSQKLVTKAHTQISFLKQKYYKQHALITMK